MENTKQQADTETHRACAVLSAPCALQGVCAGNTRSARKQEWQAGIETEGQRDGEREKSRKEGDTEAVRDGKGQKGFHPPFYRRLSPEKAYKPSP